MPAPSARLESRKSHARSRVSNHSDILPGVDGRSLIARRYRDIANAVVVDITASSAAVKRDFN